MIEAKPYIYTDIAFVDDISMAVDKNIVTIKIKGQAMLNRQTKSIHYVYKYENGNYKLYHLLIVLSFRSIKRYFTLSLSDSVSLPVVKIVVGIISGF